jgi:Ca2+-binding EF-hand superfamily protein
MMLTFRSLALLALFHSSYVVCRQPIQKEEITAEMETAATVMDGFDTDKNGKLSMAELLSHVSDASGELPPEFAGWKDGFKEADLDADGALTVKELHALLQSVQEPEQEKAIEASEVSVAEQIMDGMDVNKDGHLSLKELMDHVGDDSQVHAKFAGWKDGFKEADKDADGLLSIKELGHLLHSVSRSDQHHLVEESENEIAAQVMDGFDKDKNGQISLQELLDHVGDSKDLHAAFAGWKEGFEEADANKNGQLDLKELSSLLDHVSRGDQHHLVEESELEVAAQVMDGFDKDKNGQISLQELLDHVGDKKDLHAAFAGWKDGFAEADTNKNGQLDLKELSSLLEHVSRGDQHHLVDESEMEVAASVMAGFDTDKNGEISLGELLDHVGEAKDVHAAFEGWQDGFKHADADGNGGLNMNELASLLKEVSRGDQRELVHDSEREVAAQVMDGFDVDKDGKISLQELLDHIGDNKDVHAAFQGWQEGFKEADADQDQHLDLDELTSLLEHISREDQHQMVHESELEVAAQIMEGFDTNKNGKVSMQELTAKIDDKMHAAFDGWKEGFVQADTDQDGELTVEELANLLLHVSRDDQHHLVDQSEEEIAASIMDGFDTNKNGLISLQELMDRVGENKETHAAFEGWQQGFLEADTDQDGQLNVHELSSLLKKISLDNQHEMVEESSAEISASVMSGFDTNKDGKISLQELLDHVKDKEHVEAAFDGWKDGFKEADADNDGHLDSKELTDLLTKVSRGEQQELVDESEESIAEQVMKGWDTDKDGKLTLAELHAHVGENAELQAAFQGWKEGFEMADLDKDGHLTVAELASLLGQVSTKDQGKIVQDVDATTASLLHGFDTDKDGKVSLDEIMKHIESLSPKKAGDMLATVKEGFEKADIDKDGGLNAEELATLLHGLNERHTKHDEM